LKIYLKGGKTPRPTPQETPPPPPDPDANEQAKAAAAEARSRERRRATSGSMNKTLATSPEGVMGAAPINAPQLKSNLG
jgi:hypothetical protein